METIGLDWIGLNWIGLNWTELNWTELNWTELNWTELNWIELKNMMQMLLGGQKYCEFENGLNSSIWCAYFEFFMQERQKLLFKKCGTNLISVVEKLSIFCSLSKIINTFLNNNLSMQKQIVWETQTR